MSPTAKRALFQTPSRSSKRTKTMTARRGATRIPKSLMPEMKQTVAATLTTNTSNYAYSSIPLDLAQGDTSKNFDGAKFRIARIRVMYDFLGVTGFLAEGVRVSVIIPKDPTFIPVGPVTTHSPWGTDEYTVLYDALLPADSATSAGTFDVTGPINCEMNSTGTASLRNNVYVFVQSVGNGSSLKSDFSYSVWFTG